MKTTLLTSIIAITFAIPSFATTIQNGANCDSGVLETTSGSAELSANWTANTINLTFDPKNGGTATNTTCTYDAPIANVPTTPSKTGYQFMGWKVKVIPQCTASMLPRGEYGGDQGSISQDGSQKRNANKYGLTENGEWAAELFSEDEDEVLGIMRGTSFCSAKSGDNHSYQWGGNSADWAATYDELISAAGEAKYCWCHGTSYIPTNGEQCTVPVASRWVFNRGRVSPSNCASSCASNCGANALNSGAFRDALVGQN